MTVLQKLKDQLAANEPLIITPAEYQTLCAEVFALGEEAAAQYDDLILNYKLGDVEMLIQDPVIDEGAE